MKSVSHFFRSHKRSLALGSPTEGVVPLDAALSGLLLLAMTAFAPTHSLAAERAANLQSAGTSDLFASNRVLKVQITLAPADWEKLRNQERDAKAELSKDRLERPVAKPYTWFSADVIIDGTPLKNVGIRKRGFFGSADKDRPALNIEFDKFVKGAQFAGRSGLKLHNNKQDGSNFRQVLAYQVFAAAGVPAPRCSLALVSVNGTNLGLYSSLEGIDAAFLKRQFGSDQGNLYEAQLSDFRPNWTRTFQKKNNLATTNREDLDAVTRALEADDAHLLDPLVKVLDLDAFINFWAVESLINHWDGFAGDLNNCFVYHDPKADKLRFIAWGADATFGPHHVFVPFDPPASVWAVSYLTRRLYNHPTTQKKFRDRMQELLATVWNENHLNAEVDRLEKLAQGLSTVPVFRAFPETAQLRLFIRDRRNQIESELKQPAQPWTHPMRREIFSTPVGKISAEFSSAWVASVFAPAPAGAKAQITLDFYGRHFVGEFTDVKATPDITNPRNAALLLSGSFKGVELPISIWVSASTNLIQSGKTFDAAGPGSIMLLVAGQLGKKDWRLLGNSESGSIRLDEAGMTIGAKIHGSIQADISTGAWEDFDLAKLKKAP